MSQAPGGRLPPELQRQIDVAAFTFAGCTSVLLWDILNNLKNDYTIFFKQKVHTACLAYGVSRIAALVYALGFTVFASYPLKACQTAYIVFNAFYPVAVSASAFLFLFRVRAVYGGDRLVTALFSFLWLAVLGAALAIPFGGTAVRLGDAPQCVVTRIEAYVGAVGTIIAVYDTLVFLAISHRLAANFRQTQSPSRGAQLKAALSGAGLPAFSRALFVDGQMYYLITVAVNIVAAVLVFLTSVGSIYHGLLAIPSVTLTSIMACRVYRNTKLGITRRRDELTLPTLNPTNHGHGGDAHLGAPSAIQFSVRPPGATDSAWDAGEDDSGSSGHKGPAFHAPGKVRFSGRDRDSRVGGVVFA
ncbi:hypothetical protein B0H15DRAFT_944706 [Mycena belliarum]|uniref:Transmembrane protein n=1 Tax=Mycena belliarum TaxID=1033014 RepID=A0AAD6XZG2_9AGAR|nr:hypothetical protein B0H15DRAFT_944706 [Mycena belliae]